MCLYFLPALALLAVVAKLSARQGGHLYNPIETLARWAVSPRGLVVIAVVAAIAAFMLRSRRKCLAELRRLERLEVDYSAEESLDAG